ncbi:carboxypeptidase-like regulatory domain-containing protein [Chitinophaga solisilvae]|uniref:carboxypeptidase-like regulatory domain-containing protein n=1 Tax=Chitinophaga solisilvae TaxID=1233460 RepID=UPI0013721FD2|nr:alpha-2-macroglobulin family protein [Chitinophaga solisilvae]
MSLYFRSCILLCLSVLYLKAAAQENLSGSRRGSAMHYLYKLTDKETRTLYMETSAKRKKRLAEEKYAQTPAFSFPAGTPVPTPREPGNYLEIYARGNQLVTRLIPGSRLRIRLINDQPDYRIFLYDLNGNIITDAVIRSGKHRMPFDPSSQSYRLTHVSGNGILEIAHKGALNFSGITRITQRRHRSTFLSRLKRFFKPAPVRRGDLPGFMTTSKPVYKPLDTVKLKAFLFQRNGLPLNAPLALRLQDRYKETDTLLGILQPYRPGGYEYHFALTDSLDIDLDDDYNLVLETPASSAGKRGTSLYHTTFSYEEYELKSVTFHMRVNETHNKGVPQTVFLKATDENDLPVMDGRVKLCITAGSNRKYFADRLFIPDTLWQHEIPLEPSGETKMILPDSIFPAASMDYIIRAQFLSSSNESQSDIKYVSYSYPATAVKITQQGDSLLITATCRDTVYSCPAQLLTFQEKDTLADVRLQLPAVIPMKPHIQRYEVITAAHREVFRADKAGVAPVCLTFRTVDSVFADITSPYRLPFWYSVYAGREKIKSGYDTAFHLKTAAITKDNYLVEVWYFWNNNIIRNNYPISFAENLLSVKINSPATIFPGQKSRISVLVSDSRNRPVADADVTAYSFTSKFQQQQEPTIPYLGKSYRSVASSFRYNLQAGKEVMYTLPLNWEKWQQPLHLDTIPFYHFLHPDGVYYNTEKVKGNITQLAPFVMLNGEPQRIIFLWIDEKPVYLDAADYRPAYSFPVSPGKHHIKIRTPDYYITIDSAYAAAGVKTYLSIAAEKTTPQVNVIKIQPELTKAEKVFAERHLIAIAPSHNSNPLRYIAQQQILLAPYSHNGYSDQLAGPLFNTTATYVVPGKFSQAFEVERGNRFDISKGLIKQREITGIYSMSAVQTGNGYNYGADVQAVACTEEEIDSLYQTSLANLTITRTLFETSARHTGKLSVNIDSIRQADIRQIFLYRHDVPDFIRVYNGQTTDIGNLDSGWYRMLVLLYRNRYFVQDSIQVKAGGTSFIRITHPRVQGPDSVSTAMNATIIRYTEDDHWKYYDNRREDFTIPFNNRYLDRSTFTNAITGLVADEKGEPLPGVTIMIRGTTYGTVTNKDGRYRLLVPDYGTLFISIVGYESVEQEFDARNGQLYLTRLQARSQALQEVVVTGMGVQRTKKSLSYAISNVLHGRVAGMQMGENIRIRGNGSMEQGTPLYVIDGIISGTSPDSMDPSLIISMDILKSDVAVALYGSRAANGVILITTRKGNNFSDTDAANATGTTSGSLRHNFRDDAFWQPRLRSNENGEASFDVTFPDDITSWRTYAVAFTGQQQSGSSKDIIRSYKPVSANLALPAFAIAGDTLHVTGKLFNYLADSTSVTRQLFAGDQQLLGGPVGFRNSHIDTMPMAIPAADSLRLKYTVLGKNGYYDGEYRAVPVFPQGVQETSGYFFPLHQDTAFTVAAGTDTAAWHIYASGSALPVLLDETERLYRYQYLCNEQMASKLNALLAEKRLRKFLGEDFRREQQIRELVRSLSNNRFNNGWGWWNQSSPVPWISAYVTRSLLEAEKEGYQISLNREAVIGQLVYELQATQLPGNRLSMLEMLQLLGAKTDFRTALDTMNTRYLSSYEQLFRMALQVRTGGTVNTDSLLRKQQRSMMGNPYWGDEPEQQHLFNNSVQHTLLVYNILREKGGYAAVLAGIRAWLLEIRHPGHWRNTYESASILRTILPDMLQQPGGLTATLTLNNQSVSIFPWSTTLKGTTPLQVRKQGNMPVYFTAWQQHWNPAPQAVSGQFSVSTAFVTESHTVTKLTAGTATTMEVTVDVKTPAEYVMIEVPVPAGCSYNGKQQSAASQEVHREYLKNKVSIFCSHLGKGRYTFRIALMPRYSGHFHVNPAKAEMMYFPVFFGREGMKQVKISGK